MSPFDEDLNKKLGAEIIRAEHLAMAEYELSQGRGGDWGTPSRMCNAVFGYGLLNCLWNEADEELEIGGLKLGAWRWRDNGLIEFESDRGEVLVTRGVREDDKGD